MENLTISAIRQFSLVMKAAEDTIAQASEKELPLKNGK